MNTRLTEFPDRREWDLTEFTLGRICLSYQVTLLLAQPRSSITVLIETPLTLRVGSRIELITSDQSITTAPLLPLLHKSVASLAAFRDGRLLIKFVEGAEISVEKDAQYESWHTHGDGEVADSGGMLCSGHAGPPWYEGER